MLTTAFSALLRTVLVAYPSALEYVESLTYTIKLRLGSNAIACVKQDSPNIEDRSG